MLSHALGAVLFLITGPALIARFWQVANGWLLAGTVIFWITLMMVYVSSTLYHNTYEVKQRKLYRIYDHISIYFLIAGSYTPFMLNYFRDDRGWAILGFLWVLTFLGTIFKMFFIHKYSKLSTIIYVIMGWLAILIIEPMIETLPTDVFMWICIGGGLYTFGVLFYLWKSLYFNHLIWHFFVLGGSVSHLIAVSLCI